MPFDAAAAEERERRHPEAARKKILDDRKFVERIFPQYADIRVKILGGRVEILVRQAGIVGQEMSLEFNPLSCRAPPFSRCRDERIGHKCERLRLGLNNPGRGGFTRTCCLALFASGCHHRPTLRNLCRHSIGAESAHDIGVPVAFTAQIHPLGSDMSGSLTGGYKS